MEPKVDLLQRTLDAISQRRRLPESTYRLQFHVGFTFQNAIEIVDYLHELGVTDCYASPYLTARPGSTHGYDVIDHSQINPELGGEVGLLHWVDELSRFGMSHILDTVPNHVGVATNDNQWWNDVLEHGPSSKYANYFDITWRGSPQPELHDKVLLPVLGGPYGQVLETGELKVADDQGKPVVRYYDRQFPLSLVTSSGPRLASEAAKQVGSDIQALNGTPGDPRSFDALDDLLNRQSYRLAYWRTAPDAINYRRFFDISDLAALRQENPAVFQASHALTLRLLAEGKVAGLRIDHPDGLFDPEEYFQRLQREYVLTCAKHRAGKGWDEVEAAPGERVDRMMSSTPNAELPLYVVVEKILAADEPLPSGWPVHGTSGYDFLNMVNGFFIEPANRDRLTDVYRTFTGCDRSFAEVAYQKKQLILKTAFSSELNMLAFRLDQLAQKDRHSRDFTLPGLRRALREVIACFGVYRSYVTSRGIPTGDRDRIASAIAHAVARDPSADASLFRFIQATLLLEYPEQGSKVHRDEQVEFAGKFQQLTAPVTAKGVEDTAFYVYNRLLSLNEVGGDPERFGVSSEMLHDYFTTRQSCWPYALSALTTHDTKRSEDARARINVLSELPDEWGQCVERWSKLNERHRQAVGPSMAPDRNEEYMLYQALVGAWPLGGNTSPSGAPGQSTREDRCDATVLTDKPAVRGDTSVTQSAQHAFADRIQKYVQKALREAKVHTTWTDPNEAYESVVAQFVARVLDRDLPGEFLADFETLISQVSHWGMLNSLSQTLLRLTAPGVPDTYQGTELWDFSLVDPDNRRPVDFSARRRLLEGLQVQTRAAGSDRRILARELAGKWQDGRVKLYVTEQALRCRRQHVGLFSRGEYLPLKPAGPGSDHVFAFARRMGEQVAVVIVPRLFTRLCPDGKSLPLGEAVWQDTRCSIPGVDLKRRFVDAFTGHPIRCDRESGGASVKVGQALADFPVALLVGEAAE